MAFLFSPHHFSPSNGAAAEKKRRLFGWSGVHAYEIRRRREAADLARFAASCSQISKVLIILSTSNNYPENVPKGKSMVQIYCDVNLDFSVQAFSG